MSPRMSHPANPPTNQLTCHDCAHTRHPKCLINDELSSLSLSLNPAVALGQQAVEQTHKVKTLACSTCV